MKITKYGHCCLLIEENGIRILTDPGSFSTGQNDARDIDIVLITHEHADHLHVDSLKTVLKNNPAAVVITNSSVGRLLDAAGIEYKIVEHGQALTEQGIAIAGHGESHAEIFPGLPPVQNTGYFVADRLFYPGDAFTDPGRPVELLALPVAAPWMRIADAINFALQIQPRIAFPVHDGILSRPDFMSPLLRKMLGSSGVEFVDLPAGGSIEY